MNPNVVIPSDATNTPNHYSEPPKVTRRMVVDENKICRITKISVDLAEHQGKAINFPIRVMYKGEVSIIGHLSNHVPSFECDLAYPRSFYFAHDWEDGDVLFEYRIEDNPIKDVDYGVREPLISKCLDQKDKDLAYKKSRYEHSFRVNIPNKFKNEVAKRKEDEGPKNQKNEALRLDDAALRVDRKSKDAQSSLKNRKR